MTLREAYSAVLCFKPNSVLREFVEENKLNSENQEGNLLVHCRSDFEESALLEICSDLQIEAQSFCEAG